MSDIVRLLTESRAAHHRYATHRGRINKEGTISQHPNLPKAGHAVTEALRLRTEAHALDPLQEDMAWIEDRIQMRTNSQALIDHYVRYLAPEAHVVCV